MERMLELVVSFIIVLVSIINGAAAETYNVGGSLGWTVPPGGEADYKSWVSKEIFKVGDTLVFTWMGTHSVANVTKEDYEKCLAADLVRGTSPVTITLTSIGSHYYICNIGKHCSLGQKLNVTVVESSAATALGTTALSTFLLMLPIAITFL